MLSKKPNKAILHVCMILLCLAILFPFAFVILGSLKTDREVVASPFSLPMSLQWANYTKAWEMGGLGTCIKNSVMVTALTIIAVAFLSSMAGFAVARLKWRGNILFLGLIISGLFVVPISIMVPILQMLKTLNLTNSLFGLAMVYIGFGLPFSTFIMWSYFRGVPVEIDEAAKLDGISGFKLYWKILLPLSKPTIFLVTILTFLTAWNEFLFALILLHTSNVYTIPRGIALFTGTYATAYGITMAAVITSLIPSLIFFVIVSRKLIKAMSIVYIR